MKSLSAIAVLFLCQMCMGQALKPIGTQGPVAGGVSPIFSAQQKIVVVVLENTSYSEAISKPFFSQLAKSGALFTNYHAIGHPSQPNYVAMIAGDKMGVSGDAPYDLEGASLADLLEAKGKTWRVYAEDFPGRCYLGSTKGKYARKHVPFLSFKNIQGQPDRCANITDTAKFENDFKTGGLANYNMYIPNLNNDGHDTGAAYADNFMAQTFSALLGDSKLMSDVLFVVTFDEDDNIFGGSNKIFTVLYGPMVKPGVEISTRYDHVSLLRTIEDGFQLGDLGRKDQTANPLTGFWQ